LGVPLQWSALPSRQTWFPSKGVKDMAKTILYIGISLDGYIAGPNDETEWMDPYGEVEYGFNDFLNTVGAIIMGRRSYEIGVEKGWFSQYNYGSPIIVVSKNVPAEISADGEFTFVFEGIEAALARAREVAGSKNVYIYGGANLAVQYLQAGLIDEITLGVMPILLGDGIRLFERVGKPVELELLDSQTFDKSLVLLRYSVLRQK
jgi:dihydrofolate reductase